MIKELLLLLLLPSRARPMSPSLSTLGARDFFLLRPAGGRLVCFFPLLTHSQDDLGSHRTLTPVMANQVMANPESKSATRLNTFVRNFDKEFTALLRRDGPRGVPDSQAEVRLLRPRLRCTMDSRPHI